ncbi:O-antigen ligase family protein [Parvibaculum sp.]|uniref:O-antigen ligase family protein n=1 Tax=Parvibaculum sp. TaxID=2024848 RepID=UPI0026102F73|nr:O-antigen ligase family protein [Parvibaculum sp.]MCW5726922.1 O-antigen ligase family protein [Parvibaculum sp.]
MSVAVSKKLNQTTFRSRLRLSAIDLLFIPLLGYMVFYVWLRPVGTIGLALPLLAAALICIASRKLLYTRTYIPFLLWSTTILFFSLYELMPGSWTVHFDRFAAIRHFAPLVFLPLLATAFFIFFSRFGSIIERNVVFVLCTLYSIHVLIGALTFLAGNPVMGGVGSIYTLTNSTMPMIIALIIFLYREGTNLLVRLMGMSALLLIASSAQTFLVAVLFIALSITRKRRFIALLSLVCLAAFLAIAPLFPRELHQLDANSGVRAVLWGDVWRLIADTKGLGVGFGTEYITNQFYLLKGADWGLENFHSDYLFIGTHSTFYDMLLRVGIVGFGLFLHWFLTVIFSQKSMPQKNAGIMFYAAALIFVVSNAVNVGIYSINFLFGCAMVLGFMEALRSTSDCKSVPTGQIENSKVRRHARTAST